MTGLCRHSSAPSGAPPRFTTLVGVEIKITESKRGEWEAAVIAIRDGLNAADIATNGVALKEGVTDGAIHINVGIKP